MQGYQPVAGRLLREARALDCAVAPEQGCKRRQVPQLEGKFLGPIEAKKLAFPDVLSVYGANRGVERSAFSLGKDWRSYREPTHLKARNEICHAFQKLSCAASRPPVL
jgi:hypothetical protein